MTEHRPSVGMSLLGGTILAACDDASSTAEAPRWLMLIKRRDDAYFTALVWPSVEDGIRGYGYGDLRVGPSLSLAAKDFEAKGGR